jgi:hypothetical protein
LGNDEKSSGRCVCSATIKINKDIVMLKTKKTSSKATGRGKTSIPTKASMPIGSKELDSFFMPPSEKPIAWLCCINKTLKNVN